MGRYSIYITTRFVDTVKADSADEAIRKVKNAGIFRMRVEEEWVSEVYDHDNYAVEYEVTENGIIEYTEACPTCNKGASEKILEER